MEIQEIRRARLRQLIDERYEGSQSLFIDRTGENQGEISALLRSKSFGEKKARKLEIKCELPAGWLDAKSSEAFTKAEPRTDGGLDRPALRLVSTVEQKWMALTWVSQKELDLLTNYRRASEVGKAVIETAGETATKDDSGATANDQP
jgi:hypothetical protein